MTNHYVFDTLIPTTIRQSKRLQVEWSIDVSQWPNPMGEKPNDVVGKHVKAKFADKTRLFIIEAANNARVYLREILLVAL